jgi:hypothetical protein
MKKLGTWVLAALIGALGIVLLQQIQHNQIHAQAPLAWNGRLFLLSKNKVQGNAAISACLAIPNYHMASLWEIHEPSALKYDAANGMTNADSGLGPPTDVSEGWVRTGNDSSPGGPDDEGQANCNAWSTNASSAHGSAIWLTSGWRVQPANKSNIWPWLPVGIGTLGTASPSCSAALPVWCVEN